MPKILKKYNNIFLFIFLFYLIMGVSRYTQLLYFQANNNLENFSISYSTMAISGALSFLITNQLPTNQSKYYIKTFIPIYSIGLLLRVFYNNSFIAALSGILCGIGASVILLLVRQWLLYLSAMDEKNKSFLQSSRFTIMQTASIISTILAGILITILGKNNLAYILVLIISAITILLTLFISIPSIQIPERNKKFFNILPSNKTKGVKLYILSVLLGISSSLIASILPAIIKGEGWSVLNTSLITTIATILTLIFSFIFALPKISKKPGLYFLGTQLIVIFFSLLIPLKLGINKTNIIFLTLLIETSLAGFYILKEMMEYSFIPKKESLMYLGLIQSSFLVGDSLGSLLGSYFYNNFGVNKLFILFGIISFIATTLFTLFYKIQSKKINKLYKNL
jgi:Arabinose efflux permease